MVCKACFSTECQVSTVIVPHLYKAWTFSLSLLCAKRSHAIFFHMHFVRRIVVPAPLGERTVVVSPLEGHFCLNQVTLCPCLLLSTELRPGSIALAGTSNALWNRNGDNGHPCLVPRSRGKSFQSSHMKYDVCCRAFFVDTLKY